MSHLSILENLLHIFSIDISDIIKSITQEHESRNEFNEWDDECSLMVYEYCESSIKEIIIEYLLPNKCIKCQQETIPLFGYFCTKCGLDRFKSILTKSSKTLISTDKEKITISIDKYGTWGCYSARVYTKGDGFADYEGRCKHFIYHLLSDHSDSDDNIKIIYQKSGSFAGCWGSDIEAEGILKMEFVDDQQDVVLLSEYHGLTGDGNGNDAADKPKIYLSMLPEYQELNWDDQSILD